ncbi:MAG: hypothetical protein ACFFA3_14475 [Promethearchaeota archaeon]
MSKSKDRNFKSFIEKEIINDTKKVKGRKTAIAEIVENTLITLPVKFIYDMNEKLKHFFFIIVKNHLKHPKVRYFLTNSLANNSSDLLVQLVKKNAISNNLNIIQYSIYPKTYRTQLLIMKEITNIKEFTDSIELLKRVRKEFRETISKLRKLVENE